MKSRKTSDDPFTWLCLDTFDGVLLTPRQERLFCEGAWLLFGEYKKARKPQPLPPWDFWSFRIPERMPDGLL